MSAKTDTLTVATAEPTPAPASNDAVDRPVVVPDRAATAHRRTAWVLAVLAAVALLALVVGLVIRTGDAAEPSGPLHLPGSGSAPVDHSDVLHGTAGNLVDGDGRRVITGGDVPAAASSSRAALGGSRSVSASKIAQIARLDAQ